MSASVSGVSTGYLLDPGEVTNVVGSNGNRDALIIHNDSTIIYVKCGPNVSSTDYTYRLTKNTTLEIPNYIGIITAIAYEYAYIRVTELV
jgi:hypothetical protein